MPYNVWDGTIPVKADIQIEPMKCIHLSTENLERLIKEQITDKITKIQSIETNREVHESIKNDLKKLIYILIL